MWVHMKTVGGEKAIDCFLEELVAARPTTISNMTPTLDKEVEKGNKPSSFFYSIRRLGS